MDVPQGYRCLILGVALHGEEDGTVPATFQIIYLASFPRRLKCDQSLRILPDWLEARPLAKEAS